MEPASICGGKFPVHDFGMRANEKVGERHCMGRYAGLRCSPFPILAICLRAHVGSRRRHIEYGDTPTAYSVGDSRGGCISNTNLDLTHRIDGSAVIRYGLGDRLSRPLM